MCCKGISKIIVALSSGSGFYLRNKLLQPTLNIIFKEKVCWLLDFSKNDAKFYLEQLGVLINLDKVRDLTNFNLYLVSLLSSVVLKDIHS